MHKTMKTTKPCCDQWLVVRDVLDWYCLQEYEHIFVMPCLNGYRVNHCPCCGAHVRDFVWNTYDPVSA